MSESSLQKLRKALLAENAKRTYREIAEECGFGHPVLVKFANGRHSLSLEHGLTLARVLKVSL